MSPPTPTCATAPSRPVAPTRVAAISRSMNATTSATAAWCASAMIACVPASATAHTTDAAFGIENVKSNPATARRVPRAASSASICAMASARDHAQAWVQRGDPRLDADGSGREVLVGAAERIARDRITPHADEQLELDLRDLIAGHDPAAAEGGHAAAHPAAGRSSFLEVVPRQRGRQRAVSIARGDRLEQVLVALTRAHHPHRDRHARQVRTRSPAEPRLQEAWADRRPADRPRRTALPGTRSEAATPSCRRRGDEGGAAGRVGVARTWKVTSPAERLDRDAPTALEPRCPTQPPPRPPHCGSGHCSLGTAASTSPSSASSADARPGSPSSTPPRPASSRITGPASPTSATSPRSTGGRSSPST